MAKATPCRRLRKHLGINISKFAIETGISRPTVYHMEGGGGCTWETWRGLRSRWGDEIEVVGLDGYDFWSGAVQRRRSA